LYVVQYNDEGNYLSSCSCPDHLGLCKHIFLVSRVKTIPYNCRKNYKNTKKPATITTEEAHDLLSFESQKSHESVLSRTMKKLSLFYDNNENNPDMLDAMTENLRKLENIKSTTGWRYKIFQN
jgi:uncharacterized Zn finger protein